MDRHLRPDRLDVDPTAPDAAKNWRHWLRTFQNFLASLPDDNQNNRLSTLINFVSPSVYDLIADCENYDQAIEVLKSAYDKPQNEIFARHLLATRKQQSGQTLDQFLRDLKSLAKDCNFKSVTAEQHTNEAIRDAFISGISSHYIRQRLLERKDLDLQTAFDSARSLEMAEKQSNSYTPTTSVVSAISEEKTTLPEQTEETVSAAANYTKCYFCGNRKHPRSKCPARDSDCNICSKRGHFAKVCRSGVKSKSVATIENFVSATTASTGSHGLRKAMIDVTINNLPLKALVDSGSTDSYINAKIAKEQKWHINPSSTVISMASTTLKNKTLGHTTVNLKYNQTTYENVRLSLLPNSCADIILGHDFIDKHSALKIVLNGDKPPLVVCGVAAAKVDPPTLFANLSPECKPIATKSRRHSKDDEIFIEQEVGRLLKDGVIEKSNSPWRAQVLVTTNEKHKKRMVVDYSMTINRYTYLDAYPQKRLDKMIEQVAQYSVFSALDLASAYHQIPIREDEKIFTAFEACGNLYQFCRIPFGVTNGVSSFQRIMDHIVSKEELQGVYVYVDNVTICGEDQESHDRNLANFMETAKTYGIQFNDSKSLISKKEIDILGYRVSQGNIRPDPERLEPLRKLEAPTTLKGQRRIVGMFAYYSQWIPRFSDKIAPLSQNTKFPLPEEALHAFVKLKSELEDALLVTIDHNVPLVVETDASDIAISATLNQGGRPIAFFSRSLSTSEKRHSAVEKEAYAIVEAIRKWKHYLINSNFKLITDQQSVAFIYDKSQKSKIKNDKIQRWKIELSPFSYEIMYRPGPENVVPDTFTRCNATTTDSLEKLQQLHASLCHPGVRRMVHFIRVKNLPYSVEEVKAMCAKCVVCAELKPRFFKGNQGTLIKATQPFERLSLDFKGPLPSNTRNKYLLTMVDEYSRFPFAFACPDTSSTSVCRCLAQIFSMFGTPQYIHTDRGSAFMSDETKSYLQSRGVATSRTTPYNPQGNGQIERLNGTVWKAINLTLKSRGLDVRQWECVLLEALHSIRSLLCTETNCTPHERMFQYTRHSTNGSSLPTWLLTPGPVYLKRNVRASKYDPIVDEVELIDANPQYAHVRLQDGRESTVSLRQLAPVGEEMRPVTTESSNEHSIDGPSELETSPDIDSTSQPLDLDAGTNSGKGSPPPEPHLERVPRSKGFIRTSSYNLRSGQK